uniref:Uncharacterized protein n=1 Tax=Plectus sambesii TaxID=2011161 RepID=A0A914VVN9_9BILA
MAVDGRQPMISFAKVVSGHVDNDCSPASAVAEQSTPIAVHPQQSASSESAGVEERKTQSQASPGSKRHRGHRHRGEKRHREALPERQQQQQQQQPAHETAAAAADEPVEVVLEPAPLPAVNAWFKQASSKQGSPSGEADMDTAVVDRGVEQAPSQKTIAVKEASSAAATTVAAVTVDTKSESISSSAAESPAVVDDKLCTCSSSSAVTKTARGGNYARTSAVVSLAINDDDDDGGRAKTMGTFPTLTIALCVGGAVYSSSAPPFNQPLPAYRLANGCALIAALRLVALLYHCIVYFC